MAMYLDPFNDPYSEFKQQRERLQQEEREEKQQKHLRAVEFKKKVLNLFSFIISAFNSSRLLLLRRQQYAIHDETFVDIDLPDQLVDENENEMNFSLLDPNLLKARIITHLPKKHITAVGAQVAFTCLTTVLFPAEVSWLLNGELIQPTPDGRIFFSNNMRQLVILYMTPDDAGLLEVVASNKFGWEKSQCEISLAPATAPERKFEKSKPA